MAQTTQQAKQESKPTAFVHNINVMGVPNHEYEALPWPEQVAEGGTRWKTLALGAGGYISFFPANKVDA